MGICSDVYCIPGGVSSNELLILQMFLNNWAMKCKNTALTPNFIDVLGIKQTVILSIAHFTSYFGW